MQEIWKDIAGYEGLYQVSNLGRVYSLRKDIYLNTDSGGHVYNRVVLYDSNGKRNRIYLHRLVALTFIPNPDNLPWALHHDDNPKNNSVNNLYWGTEEDNNSDRVKRNRQAKGEACNKKILTSDQVMEIKKRFTGKRGECRKLADEYGVTNTCISLIRRGINWKHIQA